MQAYKQQFMVMADQQINFTGSKQHFSFFFSFFFLFIKECVAKGVILINNIDTQAENRHSWPELSGGDSMSGNRSVHVWPKLTRWWEHYLLWDNIKVYNIITLDAIRHTFWSLKGPWQLRLHEYKRIKQEYQTILRWQHTPQAMRARLTSGTLWRASPIGSLPSPKDVIDDSQHYDLKTTAGTRT